MKPWIPDVGVKEQVCNTMRLAAYAAERSNVVRALLQRMATLPEAIEIGRVTGLTLGQASPSVNLGICNCPAHGQPVVWGAWIGGHLSPFSVIWPRLHTCVILGSHCPLAVGQGGIQVSWASPNFWHHRGLAACTVLLRRTA